MTEQQLSDIQQKAHEAEMSVSKYLTAHALIEQTIHTVQEDEKNATLQAIRTEIHRIGVNINQIAHQANMGKLTSPDVIQTWLTDVNSFLKKVDNTAKI